MLLVLQDEIQRPSKEERKKLSYTVPYFPGAVGHIDGVVHRRNRPSFKQSLFYRKDKRFHFISTQVTVDHSGRIMHIETGFPGSLTDQSNFINSELTQKENDFFSPGEYMLADSVYFHPLLVTPFLSIECQNNPLYVAWSRLQRANRHVVEWTIGQIEVFMATCHKFRHTIPLQTQAKGGIIAYK